MLTIDDDVDGKRRWLRRRKEMAVAAEGDGCGGERRWVWRRKETTVTVPSL
jgi:hypothetical protein